MRLKGDENPDHLAHRLFERPSREDVLHAFRLILGREPEDERALEAHMLIPTVAELRRVLLTSAEFQGVYRSILPITEDHPSLSTAR
jgi:hypothetical protein